VASFYWLKGGQVERVREQSLLMEVVAVIKGFDEIPFTLNLVWHLEHVQSDFRLALLVDQKFNHLIKIVVQV